MAGPLGNGNGWLGMESAEDQNARLGAARTAAREQAEAQAQAAQQAKVKQAADQGQSVIDQGIAKGQAIGEQQFGNGSLGRVDANRSSEMSGILDQYKQQAQGLTQPQQQAMTDQGNAQVNSALQNNLRNLRGTQGANGLQGGMAAGQQADQYRAAQAQQAQNQQNVFLKNVDYQRQGLNDYSTAANTQQQSELGRQQFNIGQQNKEAFGRQADALGYGSLASANYNGAQQSVLGQQMGTAMQNAAQNMPKK